MPTDSHSVKRFRQRHPRFTRGLCCSTRRASAPPSCVGLRVRELGHGLPRRTLSVGRRARQLRAAPDVEALRRRRPLHRRARPRAPHAREVRRDSAARAQRVRRHRGQALLPARRHRLDPRARRAARRHQERAASSEGFSTITMQLARNIFPERISRDKTLIRKLKEAKVARADRGSATRRTGSSSCTSTRSTSATAPTASRRRRSATSASRSRS